jgi:hypothetical protein
VGCATSCRLAAWLVSDPVATTGRDLLLDVRGPCRDRSGPLMRVTTTVAALLDAAMRWVADRVRAPAG